jgi:DNA-binding GntR family transcriptional regulator
MIMALALAPGSVLNRLALQQEFGLSSTPIRDALLRLQEDGLVEIFPQHATVVSPIDLTLAHQAHFLRRSLELEIVRSLALAPEPRLIARLQGLIAQQQALMDAEEHIDRLRRLHLPTPGKAQDIVRHHKLIVRSIADGKPDDAQHHLRDHLSGTLSHVDEIRTKYPGYIRG